MSNCDPGFYRVQNSTSSTSFTWQGPPQSSVAPHGSHQNFCNFPQHASPSSDYPYTSNQYRSNERTPLKAIQGYGYDNPARPSGSLSGCVILVLVVVVLPYLIYLGICIGNRELLPYWGPLELKSTKCLTYNTREYTARLYDVPINAWHKTCMSMPQIIHNRTIPSPTRCEKHDSTLRGYWIVDFDEATCRPHWDRYWKKDCSAGIRTWEGQLYSFKPEDDVFEMCQSTPAHLPSGETMMKADYCDDRRRWNKRQGMVGGWFVRDSGCR